MICFFPVEAVVWYMWGWLARRNLELTREDWLRGKSMKLVSEVLIWQSRSALNGHDILT